MAPDDDDISLLILCKQMENNFLVQMMSILERFVHDQGYRYLTMDGGTTISARQPLIDQYNKVSE